MAEAAVARAYFIDGTVAGNRGQPCGEPPTLSEVTFRFAPDAQEDFLCHILCYLRISNHSQHRRIDVVAISVVESSKSVQVSIRKALH